MEAHMMKGGPRIAVTVLAVAIVGGLACQSQTTGGLTASDEAALRQALDIAMKAVNAADPAGLASVYAQDAMFLRSHAPALEGREAIQQWLATAPPISMKGQVLEIVGSGDLAYLRGTWTMTISIPGVPAPITEHGNLLLIYRKQSDGVWKITREMMNSDVPEPAPAPPPK
jgi:uncharacterized protein (TIGR02246 family)